MKVLIADDHVEYCYTLQESFARMQWDALLAHSTADALGTLDRYAEALDLILLDIEFNGEQQTGMDVLAYARKHYPLVPVIMISGHGTLEMAVRATKLGAENFIDKATITTERLVEVVQAAATKRPTQEAQELLDFLASNGIIAQSKVMIEVARKILSIARYTINVMITGETGTGKRLVAQAIHAASNRSKHPFIAVNIPSIRPELFQSEMFGHVRGAFTGAHQDRRGFFHAANRGTLFLDEIGDLSPELQTILLVPIEEKRFHRVGSTDEETVDIRFLAATDRDLTTAIRNGTFREQLYYRLREVEITLPPLRERREDIELIAQHALQEHNRGLQNPKAFTPAALEYLRSQPWHGNVRELLSAVRAGFATAADRELITDADLIEATQRKHGNARNGAVVSASLLEDAKTAAEKDSISNALTQTRGNVTKAAALLGISRETLYNIMRKHGITPSQFRS
ncbi:MAG: acetoacetate metabolism regulatory protein AtoC [Candidatus Kapaibacterium sp.]|nr:MAG: acetoacetate metabolism regulatory protein AtoC [Candidatus Kapabacteria bacterium]